MGNHILKQFNSLAPGRFKQNLRQAISKLYLVIDGRGKCENALRWISLDLADDKSALIRTKALPESMLTYVNPILT